MAHLPHAAGARRRTRLLLSRSLPLLLTLCLLPSGALHQGNLFLPAVDAVSPISGGAALSPSRGAQAFRQKFLSSEARALSQAAKGFPEGVSPRPLGSARAAGGIAVAGDAAASSFAMVRARGGDIDSIYACVREGSDSSATTVEAQVEVTSARDCQRACRTRGDCSHAVLNKRERMCYLKTGFWEVKNGDSDVVGVPRSCNSECIWKDKNTSAGDIQPHRVLHSPFECLIWCRTQDACKYFLYNIFDRRCWLKGDDGKAKMHDGAGFLLSTREWCTDDDSDYVPPVGQGWSAGLCMHPQNKKAGGTPVKELADTKNADACQKQCKKLQTCTYFSFDRNSKMCQLFAGPAFEVTQEDGYVAGPRTCTQTCFLEGQRYQKGEIDNKTLYSALDCQVWCGTTPACEFFSYSRATRNCQLFDGTAKSTELVTKNSISGPKAWCS
ncbi:PAN domain-containing protein [Besnoitia besnoiti]|uniref:PAN domain-containing protein n=1 Tax=Besnoitia besnoiti TaxID=94643 RepID=A0A2A9M1K1_BESBE|nr:PAN domain-containing protein [Besnoitia besnoiti]PFH31849.1 PAN domain-containing protein [Besnoitia besnoiti]